MIRFLFWLAGFVLMLALLVLVAPGVLVIELLARRSWRDAGGAPL